MTAGMKRHIEIDNAGPTVGDVMMREPHTNAASESVADVRATLAKPSVKLLVVVDGARFAGTVTSDDLPDDDDATLAAIARTDGPRLGPDDSVDQALEIHRASGAERIPVVGVDGELAGLVCLNSGSTYFCA
jgi:CBS domain-containing protein